MTATAVARGPDGMQSDGVAFAASHRHCSIGLCSCTGSTLGSKRTSLLPVA
ncbi:hypothetical protein CKAH01_10348 [Colletotrichum kahawae]|uniref:Uncharacterized protein n=1 Tax=Colletotrichum kahawae TaxID=34407 RepID=A0AAD9XX69_COLKA|nr:hypothetical protein CKAH01_10348 [Colletotrichum kahawae]